MKELMNRFRQKKILIIGDLMLDTYLKGEVTRVSSEAPVPVIKIENEYHDIGGAGNVAANIVSLGGHATLFSFVGDDHAGIILKNLLLKQRIESIIETDEKTIQKIRLIGSNQQLARADHEIVKKRFFSRNAKSMLRQKASEADMIIVSDYAKGVINEDTMSIISEFKNKTIIDPKPANKELYKNVFLLTPNEKELFEMTSLSNLEEAGEKLKEELQANILVTRGKKGMSLFSDKQTNIPTYAKEVLNVTGAGDTVVAALALSIASGASISEAAIIANHAAGITVEKEGTYAVGFSELSSRILTKENKIVNFERLLELVDELKQKDKKIVWTNGCFDLLHVGHTRNLREAKKFGDILVVGLNSDESVRKLKGEGRPVQTERERAEILSSLEFVDYVIIFPELDPKKYLRELQPDIYTKGGDYSLETLQNDEEGKIVSSYGGEIKIIPFVEGKSTSNLLNTIKPKNDAYTNNWSY